MKLWLVTRRDNTEWDTYDSAVVAASTRKKAKAIEPEDGDKHGWWRPEDANAEYLGEAKQGTKSGVICASFNAG